jgi:dTDP-glucose 4,6-dehydratase
MHIYAANRFERHGLKPQAIAILSSAEEILGEIPEISNELAMLYMETGNREKGLEKYTNMMLAGLPFETVKPVFESHVTDSLDYVIMQRLLLKKIQEYPEITALSEGLKWTFLKQENWSSAFLYTRSLDKRLKENGTRVYELGQLCQSNKQFNIAIQCFDYCINLKEACFDLPACQSALIDVTYEKTILSNPDADALIALRNRMRAFETNYGPQEASLNNALKLAQLLVRYDSLFQASSPSKSVSENTATKPTENGSNEAETLLRKYLNEGSYLKKTSLAKVKMALGDVLLAAGDVWTSELLFAQVEKDFKEEEMGQFAKFKRAELSFYRGDFDWASMQLEVLKSATTQLISTDEVYGTLGDDGKFTEETPYDPNSPYSASKASSDHFVRAYHETYKLPVVISNCSNNYGSQQFPEKLIPLMIHNITNNKPLPVYGKGENIRDWLWVEDHARAIETIYFNGRDGETYNIGGNNEWKNIDLVHKLCEIMDRKLGRAEGDSAKLITYVTDRKGHDFRYAIDASKLESELGWSPSVAFDQGFEKTIDWYLENNEWLERVTSGAYADYYQAMYASR